MANNVGANGLGAMAPDIRADADAAEELEASARQTLCPSSARYQDQPTCQDLPPTCR